MRGLAAQGAARRTTRRERISRLALHTVGPAVRRGPTRFARETAARLSETSRSARRLAMRGEGFEPSRDVPGRSLQSLPGLRLAGFESSDCTGFHASSRCVAGAPHRSRLENISARGGIRTEARRARSLRSLRATGRLRDPPRTRTATHVRSSRRVSLAVRSAHRSTLRDASLRSASRYARGGIRTHGPLQERILSPPPLSELGHPRVHRRCSTGPVIPISVGHPATDPNIRRLRRAIYLGAIR